MSDTPPRRSPTRLQRLRRTIMAGLTIIVPLWLTGWVLKFLFDWADGFSAPLIRQVASRSATTSSTSPAWALC